MIPGGRYEFNDHKIIEYIKRTYPKLQYIVSVCTGAKILAKTGILDGKRATTSKYAWGLVVQSAPNVNWVSELEQPGIRFSDSSLVGGPGEVGR